ANADGSLKQELSYDAWGRLRDPSTQVAYAPGSEPALFFGRGYTGHEHLPWFGVINMNARLYDPALGRFLSPDPHVQNPFMTQHYNRYTYAMNNPLVYIDQDGEIAWFIPILIGGALFGTGNVAAHIIKGDINNFGDALKFFAQGAVAGAIVGATWSFGLASLSGTSLLGGGSLIQGMRFASQGFLQKIGWTIMGAKAISALSTVTSMIRNPENAGKILLGRTYTDNFGQALSRYT
ncbi:RHS repeat domain-containing protein, partial [Proteiniphilum sp. X52]|uniref:RHS repeat domain-containing protein n=1 Tax=Proteiniphilum sp. X52 TaxID=2382159 RepID=UPI000F413ACD